MNTENNMSKTQELVVPVNTGVVAVNNFNSGFNAEDFHIPRLNCIQKMSQIEGNPGEIVIDRRAAVVKPGKKLPVTVVSIQKSWTEKVPFDGEAQARIANSPEEAAALKLDSNFPIIPRADIILLLPHDSEINTIDEEEASELFPYLIGETAYQLGRLTVQSFAYDHTFKIINSFHTGNPDRSLHDQVWNFGSMSLERGRYSWFVPVLGRSPKTQSKEVVAFLSRLAKGGEA